MASPAQFAVLLKAPGSPPVNALKRAFQPFMDVTEADAVRLSVSAHGILRRHLNRDAARAVQRALQAEGIEAAVVAEDDLPKLPEGVIVRRLELSPSAFLVYDLLGAATTIAWDRLGLIAAGAVRHFGMSRTEKEHTELRFNPVTGLWPKTIKEVGHKVQARVQLVLELLLADGAKRYRIEAAQLPFKYVLDRPDLPLEARFVWLVRECCGRAPGALLNHGARCLQERAETMPEYENAQMLADEMVWLLWQKPGTGA